MMRVTWSSWYGDSNDLGLRLLSLVDAATRDASLPSHEPLMDHPTTRFSIPATRSVPLSTRTFVIAFAVVEFILIVGALVYSAIR